jgi:hypothetical protein
VNRLKLGAWPPVATWCVGALSAREKEAALKRASVGIGGNLSMRSPRAICSGFCVTHKCAVTYVRQSGAGLEFR